MERIRVHTSELMERAKTLRAGDQLLLSGTIYTARDAAHKRICAQLDLSLIHILSGPFRCKDFGKDFTASGVPHGALRLGCFD